MIWGLRIPDIIWRMKLLIQLPPAKLKLIVIKVKHIYWVVNKRELWTGKKRYTLSFIVEIQKKTRTKNVHRYAVREEKGERDEEEN